MMNKGAGKQDFGNVASWNKDFGKNDSFGNKGDGKGNKGGGLRDFNAKQKVWLGNIPDGCDRNELRDHMAQAGKVQLIVVNKGQGGVAYSTAEEAQNAMEMLNGTIFSGNAIEVD